jgi:hypothetical protein
MVARLSCTAAGAKQLLLGVKLQLDGDEQML